MDERIDMVTIGGHVVIDGVMILQSYDCLARDVEVPAFRRHLEDNLRDMIVKEAARHGQTITPQDVIMNIAHWPLPPAEEQL